MYQNEYAELLSYISEQDVVELTSKLIRFKSINPPGDELPLALYLGEILEKEGLDIEILEHGPSRGSLVARLAGKGQAPGLIFSGHLDVVPADGSWERDPFAGEVADGRVWGRGATDMKGGVAAMISAATALARSGLTLKGDLYLCLTAGEETDNLGAAETVNSYSFGPVQAVFISEPSNNEIYTAEKGALWVEIITHGKSAHISRMEDGRNALMMMLAILREIDRTEIPYEFHPLLGDYRRSINTLHAGSKTNTIPSTCVATIDQRTLPGQDHTMIMRMMEEIVERVGRESGLLDFSAEVRPILDNPALEVSPDDPALRALFDIVAEVNGLSQDGPKGVGYFTDAVKFAPALNVPFAICGPGNPLLNHKTNEWVEIAKLIDSAHIHTLAAAKYLG